MAFAVKGVWVRLPAAPLAAAVSILLALAPAEGASASANQQLLIEDEHHLLERSHAEQLRVLDLIEELGADKVRAVIWWRSMLADPRSEERPRGNPADSRSPLYDAERWERLDSLVQETRQRGIALMLTPASASGLEGTRLHLPKWAQLASGAPRVRQFTRFVKALARRYSGDFLPAGAGRPLPRVVEWSLWNEPNALPFLQPQWRLIDGRAIPWSPVLYRRLYNAAARALRRNGHRQSRIYFGETASTGVGIASPLSPMAPALFVRELTCLDRELERYTGSDARRRECAGYRPLDTDGLATHFYSAESGTAPAFRVDPDVALWTPGDPSRPGALLTQLAQRGRLPRGLPVYNTEAGFQHHPLRRPLLTAGEQSQSLNVAEYLQWLNPSVASFAQYLIYDDPSWFTGLRYIDGPPKPAYFALRMPIVARDRGNGNVEVWGATYRRGPGRLTQILVNGLPLAAVNPSNRHGYFQTTVLGGPGALVQSVDVLTGYRSRQAIVTPGF
jgi:hypothetical protein